MFLPTRKILVVSSAAVIETPKSAAMMGTAALGAEDANVLCESVRTACYRNAVCALDVPLTCRVF